jgi:hypothetical protein
LPAPIYSLDLQLALHTTPPHILMLNVVFSLALNLEGVLRTPEVVASTATLLMALRNPTAVFRSVKVDYTLRQLNPLRSSQEFQKIPLQLGFDAPVMVKDASPLNMEMHLPAGRLLRPSTEHPAAMLQPAQVEVVNESVSTAALVATSAARIVTMVGNCMVRVFSVGDLAAKETGCLK